MNFNEYSQAAELTAVYPKEKELEYLTLGLVNEAGEVAGKVKKYLRGDYDLTPETRKIISDELGDVCWYLSRLAVVMRGSDGYETIHEENVDKLLSRMERGVIRGDGDER